MLIRLSPYLAAFGLLVAVYSIGHIKGTASCEIGNAKKEAAIVVKGEKDHAKIESKVMSLPDAALNKQLSRFMRD